MLKEEVEPGDDAFRGEREQAAAAESSREVPPAGADVAIDPEEGETLVGKVVTQFAEVGKRGRNAPETVAHASPQLPFVTDPTVLGGEMTILHLI
jgi:hypothetical protein